MEGALQGGAQGADQRAIRVVHGQHEQEQQHGPALVAQMQEAGYGCGQTPWRAAVGVLVTCTQTASSFRRPHRALRPRRPLRAPMIAASPSKDMAGTGHTPRTTVLGSANRVP